MAEEAHCLDFYNHVYQEFSAGTHSTWHHVARFNLKECENPLHRYHRVKRLADLRDQARRSNDPAAAQYQMQLDQVEVPETTAVLSGRPDQKIEGIGREITEKRFAIDGLKAQISVLTD